MDKAEGNESECKIAKSDDKQDTVTDELDEHENIVNDVLQSTDAATSEKEKPKNVASKHWERFRALSQKADKLTKRSTQKRIKHLQKTVLEKVQDSLCTDEERSILRKHDVKLASAEKGSSHNDVRPSIAQDPVSVTSEAPSRDWKDVQKYLGINDHLQDKASASHQPRSGLEKRMDEAINTGDMSTAEVLSDELSDRNFGVKISEAFAAKDYLKRKKEEAETEKMKKKKKLNWGFEHKQKWETKSNM